MRVKFGYHIDDCVRVTHRDNSSLLIISTSLNQVYTVSLPSINEANRLYMKLLTDGYLDVSDFEYNN